MSDGRREHPLIGQARYPDVEPDRQVGWCQRGQDSYGVNHRCLTCQPARPHRGHWEPVKSLQLAATRACTAGCGRVLSKGGAA